MLLGLLGVLRQFIRARVSVISIIRGFKVIWVIRA